MTSPQESVLRVLSKRSMSTIGVAMAINSTVATASRTLDALYRKSLVTITPENNWTPTERGRRKVGG